MMLVRCYGARVCSDGSRSARASARTTCSCESRADSPWRDVKLIASDADNHMRDKTSFMVCVYVREAKLQGSYAKRVGLAEQDATQVRERCRRFRRHELMANMTMELSPSGE